MQQLSSQRLALVILVSSSFLNVAASEVIDIGSRRELFVDRYLIDSMHGVRLRLQTPQYAGVALTCDQPWEGAYSQYFTIIRDGDIYRMYYRGLPVLADNSNLESTCYAESRDGIHWAKPNIGLYEVDGTFDNNVILHGQTPASHNFAPFLDTRIGVAPSQRFKSLSGSGHSGLMAYASADGFHWNKLCSEAVITAGAFDSMNVAFWSESEECYICYFRTYSEGGDHGIRTISRVTSPDFINWSEPTAMTYGDVPLEHLYTNQTVPYYRAPHIYIALPMRFFPDRSALSAATLDKLGVDAAYRKYAQNECTDGVLMTTRGGSRFDRTFMEAFVRPGLDPGNWVSRSVMAARGMVQTGPNEISLYYEQRDGQKSKHLARFTIRTDGFASLHAPYAGGEIVTKLVAFDGDKLALNCSTSAAGSIRVEIQDANGKPVPGFALDECESIIGDAIEHEVEWKARASLASLIGKPIRMRIVMHDSDLYAFQFK